MDQTESITSVSRHRETASELWERHRRYYFEAQNNGTIALLISLATFAGRQEGADCVWRGLYKGKEMVIRATSQPHVTVMLADDLLCTNETPGKEFLIPDEWILIARDALEAFEAEKQERARQAEINRIYQQAQKELGEKVEAVHIFSVLEA